MNDKKDKAIRVSGRTRDTLRAIGMKNETYDDVIKRLIYELNQAEQERKHMSLIIAELKGATKS